MIPTFEQAEKQYKKLMSRIEFLTNQSMINDFEDGNDNKIAEQIATLLEKVDELEKHYPVL